MAKLLLQVEECKKEKFDIISEKLFEGKIKGQEVFLLAAAYGYKYKKRLPLTGKKADLSRKEYLRDSDWALISAIVYSTVETKEELKSLDSDKILSVIEEYANGGIDILFSEYENTSESQMFFEKFEADLLKMAREILGKMEGQ